MIEGIGSLNSLAVDLAGAGPRAAAKADQVIDKTAHDIEATSKQLAPVDTGNLKNSIGVDRTGGLSAVVGPTAEYGAHVEYGTATQGPQAYMGPAVDRHAPAFYDAMGDIADDL